MTTTLLITGGTGDLGHQVVKRLAESYRCLIFYRREEDWQRLRDSVKSENLVGILADVSKESSIEAGMQQVESIFGIVHLVGAFEMNRIEETTLETWNRLLNSNATAAFLVLKSGISRLQRGGRIVVISSAATLKPPAKMSAYVASKATLNALVDVLAVELKDRKITVNAILPTALDTPTMRKEMDRAKLVPLDTVAETILFLLSEAGANVTGSRVILEP